MVRLVGTGTWVEHKDCYLRIVRKYDSSIILTTKDSWFWRACAWLVAIFTFGGISRQRFLSDFGTTLGPVQAYPSSWSSLSTELLIHEARHTAQARWFGLGISPWLGLPLMAVAYLLLPLPLGLAYFRYMLELDADRATWRQMLRDGMSTQTVLKRAAKFGKLVGGGSYGWAWPGAEEGFKRAAAKVALEDHALKGR
jgi:hypothetical protein